MMQSDLKSLDQQRMEFANRRFLATPLAGLIAWLIIGISGLVFPLKVNIWVLFIATGSIVYLGLFISRFTGENFLDRRKPRNDFDALFLMTVAQAVLVYSIAIPFFLTDPQSLPLSVGILTGTMWLPFSWIVKHWVGLFHAIVRTVVVLILWYLLPDLRFVAIPFAIAGIYIFTLIILNRRKTLVVD